MCLRVARTGRNLMGFECTGGDMLLKQDDVNFYWCLSGLTLMDPEKYAPESAVPRRNYICLTTVLAGMIFSEIHPLNRQSSQKHKNH